MFVYSSEKPPVMLILAYYTTDVKKCNKKQICCYNN